MTSGCVVEEPINTWKIVSLLVALCLTIQATLSQRAMSTKKGLGLMDGHACILGLGSQLAQEPYRKASIFWQCQILWKKTTLSPFETDISFM